MHCSAITLGRPCHSRAVTNSPYCAHHQPTTVEFPPPHAGEEANNDAEPTQDDATDQRKANAETRINNANLISPGFRNCQATTRHGKRCRVAPRRGETLCLNHRPGANPEAAIATARASRKASPAIELLNSVIALNDRTSIQAVLDEVIRLALSGRIDYKRARIVLQACAIAVRNFDPAPITLSGPKPQQHDWQSYFGRVKAALLTIDPLLAANEPADDEDPAD
ncbi:MAG: hypothetical protein AB7J35_04095 [Dehalococcoidia bacterium]